MHHVRPAALAALWLAACASPSPKGAPSLYDPGPGRVADVTAISGLRGSRAQVAATVAEVGRAQGFPVALIGAAPDTVALGPVSVAQCQATYHVTFSDPDPADPRVLVFVRGRFYEPGDTVAYLVKTPDSGCGRDAWDRLVRLTVALDEARRAGR